MVIYKNEQKRILTVWLTKEDQQNTACMASLQPLIREWSAQKYLPVIFRSGKENLEENTSAMLKHNREVTVRREMEREKS